MKLYVLVLMATDAKNYRIANISTNAFFLRELRDALNMNNLRLVYEVLEFSMVGEQ